MEPILQFFAFAHLPPNLQTISMPFAELAHAMVHGDNNAESGTVTFGPPLPRNAERSVALRKLLEAKDAAVRAALFQEPPKVGSDYEQTKPALAIVAQEPSESVTLAPLPAEVPAVPVAEPSAEAPMTPVPFEDPLPAASPK